MKAVRIEAFGSPDGLAVVDLPDPEPGPGEVVIATEAIGVGGVDALIRSGALGDYGFAVGHVLGSEVAGTVAAVGDGVDPAWRGRRVWAFTGLGGGYAERVAIAADALVPLPDDLAPTAAVTLGTSAAVAHFALRHARFGRGQSLLVRGAAGGIGVLAVQEAARGGAAAVAVTTSSPERGARLRALGATHVLDRSGATDDASAPEDYDVILDIVVGPDLPEWLGRLAPNGRLVVVGVMGGPPPPDFGLRLFADFRRSPSFAVFSADSVSEADRRAVTAEAFAAAVRGEVEGIVHDTLPLNQAAEAHARMDAGEVFGRLVLEP